ncbi:hypothetical protein TNCV_5124261 [Trichonephila clavipes]|nr:hypothetical protein TNCV_5124261 [Trichonephila clavipes]
MNNAAPVLTSSEMRNVRKGRETKERGKKKEHRKRPNSSSWAGRDRSVMKVVTAEAPEEYGIDPRRLN